MENTKLNFADFVDAVVSEDQQKEVSGGMHVRRDAGWYTVDHVYGDAPYTTYMDGMNIGEDTI